jgi:hypothetical protein
VLNGFELSCSGKQHESYCHILLRSCSCELNFASLLCACCFNLQAVPTYVVIPSTEHSKRAPLELKLMDMHIDDTNKWRSSVHISDWHNPELLGHTTPSIPDLLASVDKPHLLFTVAEVRRRQC